jgi:DnaJ-class molecular chaperone
MQQPIEPKDPNHYWELGVAQNAASSEIRKAYMELSVHHHPDKFPPGVSDLMFGKVCCDILSTQTRPHLLSQIKDAWEVLIDPTTRAEYSSTFRNI